MPKGPYQRLSHFNPIPHSPSHQGQAGCYRISRAMPSPSGIGKVVSLKASIWHGKEMDLDSIVIKSII